MNLTKEQKKERSQSLASEIKQSAGIFFTAYQGLKFKELAGLRESLSNAKCKFRIERNAILTHALKNAGIEGVDENLLKGPTAVAILKEDGDVAMSAKSLADFTKQNAAFKIRAGYTDGVWYDEAKIKILATIGSKEENLSKFAGALYNAVAQSAQVLQAPIRDLAYVLKAVEDSKK
ncbi:MAG: 50S ribosomal protein L10 [Elusimicrobiaceae bacterium]|nr:50S ribosomal protein L10 [Elusimicrobiaceae bacterium]MBQ6224071.1 50S ribosomal protein L10 [Campylobacter sp.]